MSDCALFAAHYRRVLDALGQRHELLPDGSIHTMRHDVHFLIGNSAPDEPEHLLIECPAPAGPDPELVRVAVSRTRVPRATTLYTIYDRVVARAELFLAGPGNLPRPDLLTAVLPATFDRLTATLRAYTTEYTLAGIQRASDTSADTQPGLWTD